MNIIFPKTWRMRDIAYREEKCYPFARHCGDRKGDKPIGFQEWDRATNGRNLQLDICIFFYFVIASSNGLSRLTEGKIERGLVTHPVVDSTFYSLFLNIPFSTSNICSCFDNAAIVSKETNTLGLDKRSETLTRMDEGRCWCVHEDRRDT